MVSNRPMPDLSTIFLPDTPILEIFIRGTLTYLVLYGILRLTMNRSSGTVGMTDLLVLVLIADAAQNAMASDYKSWTDGMLLVATIVGWAYAMDALAYRFPTTIGRWVHPKPRPLVLHGRPIGENLRKELISEEELATQLRLQGIDDLSKVRWAAMEGNGQVSVIEEEGGSGASGGSALPPG
jgi:uncharacterized membrane protein YcaP (DUF421 family)